MGRSSPSMPRTYSRPRFARAHCLSLSVPVPFPACWTRVDVVDGIQAALASSQSVELIGAAGSGKTALLRYLSYRDTLGACPDGVIYLTAHDQPIPDLLQRLFDVFYEEEPSFKPTEGQIRHALQAKRTLILLDDAEQRREALEEMINGAPACAFVVASTTRHLLGETRALAVGGLPAGEAMTLVGTRARTRLDG